MSASDPSCQDLCTAIAQKQVTPFTVLGLCNYPVKGHITDVVVTGCHTSPMIDLEEISSNTLLMGVGVSVDFDYTRTHPDGSTLRASSVCNPQRQITVWFELQVVEEDYTIGPLVEIVLDCAARDAGFDPDLSVWEFIVTVTGSVTAWGCDQQVVNVQLCPSVESPTVPADPSEGARTVQSPPAAFRLRLNADRRLVNEGRDRR